MKLQTTVADVPNKVSISYTDKIMLLGSCFADNMGMRMSNYGFDVITNPFGTLYNPQSILNSIKRMSERKWFTEEECIEMGANAGRVCSFSHHTSFASRTTDEFLSKANTSLDKSSSFFKECNKIIITLGTSWCYRHKEKDVIVSNCLKRPGTEFHRELMDLEQVINCLKEIIETSRQAKADKNLSEKEFIFTVSPIRHLADGAHGNQLSKSTLLLATNNILDMQGTDYFPSFEIIMDELRDYRFYAEDMCHPTKQAEDYIFERFTGWAMDKTNIKLLEDNIKAYKRSQHKTLL